MQNSAAVVHNFTCHVVPCSGHIAHRLIWAGEPAISCIRTYITAFRSQGCSKVSSECCIAVINVLLEELQGIRAQHCVHHSWCAVCDEAVWWKGRQQVHHAHQKDRVAFCHALGNHQSFYRIPGLGPYLSISPRSHAPELHLSCFSRKHLPSRVVCRALS